MNNLHDILANAQNGEAMAVLGREFGLTSEETQVGVLVGGMRDADRERSNSVLERKTPNDYANRVVDQRLLPDQQ
jgi:hypothetical protein